MLAAVHLSQVLSSGGGIPDYNLDVVVNSSDLQSGERMIYDFDTGDGYSLLFSDQCPNNTFSIDPDTGQVMLTEEVESPTEEDQVLCVETSQGNIMSLQTYNCFVVIETTTQSYGVLLTINVLPDSAGTRIQFQEEFYTTEVTEGVQSAPVLGANGIQAISLPITGLLTPSYRILNGPFTLSEYSVQCIKYIQLSTTQALDIRMQDYYEVTVEAYTTHARANATIKVSVLDVNDNAPVLNDSPTSATVRNTSLSIGERVVQFQASDSDVGLNSRLFYSLTSLSSAFTINPFSGSIFRYSSLNLQQTAPTVAACDLGHPQHCSQANFDIFIESDHQQLPLIHDLEMPVASEADLINHVVSTVHITYSTPGTQVMVNLESLVCNCFRLSTLNKDPNGQYSVDILVNRQLDFESSPDGVNITINVRDTENPQLASSTTVTIDITDENESPMFSASEYEITVLEGIPVTTEIFRLSAIDPDIGINGIVTYSFTDEPSNNPFSLESTTGIIHSSAAIDYKSLKSIDLTVSATDGGGKTAQTLVKISILDRNDQKPSFAQTEQTITILETISANESIFNFVAVDGDSQCNGAISYSILHSEPSVFHIDSISGLLYPLQDDSVDYEKFQSAVVVVRASDLGSETQEFADTTLHINIGGVNDERPQMSKIECPCFILEGTSTLQTCQQMTAYDPDSTSLTYAFHSGNENNLFSINEMTSIVSTHAQLVYSDGLVYDLEIIASDGELESDPEILRIIVVDRDNVSPSYDGNVIQLNSPLGTPVGSELGNVTVQQGDAGYNALTIYNIITPAIEDVIRIDTLSGNLYLNSVPESDAYSFSVTATDGQNPLVIATASVTVQFTGQYNNPPEFPTLEDHINIAGNSQTGEVLYTFAAVDDDDGDNGVLIYSLETSSIFFDVSSDGSLSLIQSLSSEVGSEFELIILVSDSGTEPKQDTLELTVTVYESSINIGGESFNHNPGIGVRHYFAHVIEETSVSTQILQLPVMEGSSIVQYAILPQGNFFSAFMIQDQNKVYMKDDYQHVFDRSNNEAVFITIRAQYATNFHYISLTIVINDTNNNGPIFSQNQYSAEIYRNTPEGGYIFQLHARDSDIGSNAITTYSIDPSSTHFSIVDGTGFVEVNENEDLSGSYTLTIVASDARNPTLPTDTTQLLITILQTSNTQPIIDPMSYTVPESEVLGTVLEGPLVVIDPDNGTHGHNLLCIASGNKENKFRLQGREIVVQDELDHESIDSFTISIMAYDTSLNPASSATQISIMIEDTNDAPIFTPARYFATITENNPAIEPVLTVTALDEDEGDSIQYSINDTSFFSVHPTSGVVSTTTNLNRESVTQHSFLVTATDSGGRTSLANVQVLVLDVNDNDPIFFSPNFVTISEDTAVGTEVIQLEATDEDDNLNGMVKFEIVSGNDANIFVLEPFSGSLKLATTLDYETPPQSFSIEFSVTDRGFPSRTSATTHQITFSVENANDNFPAFSDELYSCSILEGSNVFSPSCEVGATDADESDTISYTIVGGNTESTFQINTESGILSRLKSIDRESIPRFILKIKATDSGSPSLSSFALLIIEIEDQNDDIPKFDPIVATHIADASTRLSHLYFSELLPNNSLLFFARAIDQDEDINSEISYNIISENLDIFYVDSNSSAVFLVGSLDYETSQTHVVQIQATNPSGTSTSQTYTINVLNENENLFAPVFSPNSTSPVSMSMTTPIGAHLTQINATDSDPALDGEVRYYITGGSGYGYFTIDHFTGDVSVLYSLTGIESSKVTLDIMAADTGFSPLRSSFTLLVFLLPDDGAKPFFTEAMYTAFTQEAFGASNMIFASVAAPVNGRCIADVTYSIVSGGEGKFSINSSSGAISNDVTLNREMQSIYTLFLSASRGPTANTSYTIVAIEVEDSNDNTPTFQPNYSATIFNDHAIGVNNAFMRVFAIDNDAEENSQLQYSITSDSSNNFAIDSSTGDLYLIQNLPSDTTGSYDITVSVTDMGTLPLTASTSFTITAIAPSTNDNVPFFSNSSALVNISENAIPGVMICTVQANDSSGDHLVYRITPPLSNFAIMPNSGKVYLIKPLDREEEDRYTIRIEASDGSLTSSLFLLNVRVNDINDNRPEFTTEEYVFTVEEHSSTGTIVGSITATDSDAASSITYSLTDSKDPNSISIFSLSVEGELQVLGVVDRELQPVHILTVSAEDSGTPSLTTLTRVKILVTDINDNQPEFVSPPSNVSVSENTPVGTPFFHLSAFDPDIGVNGSVTYSLSPNTTPFDINQTTGEIYIAMELDAESKTSHSLEIVVSSLDTPTSTETTTLSVLIVDDEMDSIPVLIDPGSITVSENIPLYSVVAHIGDNTSLSAVYYEILSGNEENVFFVEPLTGVVRTATELDRESISSFTLSIQGSYHTGNYTNVSFTVSVSDVNDNTPSFSHQYLEYTLSEDFTSLKLNYTDNDSGINQEVGEFYISDPRAAKFFKVDSLGNIKPLELLDREGKFAAIEFDLYLIDGGNPPLFDLARVSITVADVNDNPPYFLQPNYDFVVSLPVVVDTTLFSIEARDMDEDTTIRYSLSGGNGTSLFSINAITGDISVSNNYKLQSHYSLTIAATDQGHKASSVSVSIVTKQCGFKNLLFNPREVSQQLSENIENGTVVFTPSLLTFDQPANIRYSFSTPDILFEIDQITGVVRLRTFLDREQQSLHQFTIHAIDASDSLRIAHADIEIIVEDENDNAPMFVSAPYITYITGNYTGGVIRARAVDIDEGSNGEVRYQLKAGCSGLFSIEENTGQISLNEALDTISLEGCTLNVVASDNGEPKMSASTTVTINVVLSNAPLFTMGGVYSAQVNESASRGTTVITLLATATSNTPQIRYNMESSITSLPFSIEFTSGEVTVNGIGLDFETNSSYRLLLEAVDLSTTLTGRATLDIQVLDENDNRPQFNTALYQNSLEENSDTGTSVEQVMASDLDSGLNSHITYFIDPDNIATTLFNIEEETGLITTSVEIDREEYDLIRFSVLAKDQGNPPLTGTTTVQIEVQNVNDNIPVFIQSTYQGTVLENDQPGASILFVTATDADGDDLDYYIVSAPGSSNFDVGPSGLITLDTSASNLLDAQYTLNVSAFDGIFYGYTEVIVELENENNNAPVFNASVYQASILENASIGTFVAQVFATDDDRGENGDVMYSMSSSLFGIDPDTGIITVSSGLDREAYPNGVTLIVIARDGGGRTGTTEVDIDLGDVNDNAPSFTQSMYGFDVVEGTLIGTTVSTVVMATDPDYDSNGMIQYSIQQNGNQAQFPFAIDEQSGAIRTILSVDPGFEDEYTFTVTAVDMGSPAMTAEPSASVTVQVVFAGEVPPQFETTQYSVEILENNIHGAHLLTPLLAMTNETITCSVVTYSLIGNNMNLFEIDNDVMANITVNTILDHEERATHTFTIEATCLPTTGTNTVTSFAVITVSVLDMNEEPDFERPFYIGSILEGIPVNTIVEFGSGSFIQAEDVDDGLNALITYSIIGDVPFAIGSLSGIVTVTGALDRETQDQYDFTAVATDSGNPPLSDTVSVRVVILDINDSPPIFEQSVYNGQVLENSEEGTHVLTVEASDADLGEFAVNTYSISGNSVFRIGETSGVLTVLGNIDREMTPMYTLLITASDGINQAQTAVVINVTDANDNPPVFNNTQYEIAVPENYETGQSILQVTATDIDLGENANISYSLLEEQDLIQINSTSGEISFIQTPDYEMSSQGHFEFRVTATNPNNEDQRALATLIIDLIDLNDNAPSFMGQEAPLQVTENQPSGITVVRVIADDLDSGLNARVEYSLSEESQEYFSIDSQTGTILTQVTFDRELNSTYEIAVTATDLGDPPLSSNTTLVVEVLDINDNPPVFSQEVYMVSVLESVLVGSAIRNIRAEDLDEGINAEIVYRLTGDNSAHFNLMILDDGSVDLGVAQELNHESINKYNLNITAFDGGFPFLQATAPLTITILDENDNPPQFDPPLYHVEHQENLTIGSEVVRVQARDPDSADITRITYSLFEPENHLQFEVNISDGRILLAEELDFETTQVHTLIIQADDQVNTLATASVIVTVTNVNDNAPEFVMSNFTKSIEENQPRRELFDFTVHDRDRGSDPSIISFKIESGNIDGIFTIDTTSGALFVDSFDFETLTSSSYLLTITANDNADPPLADTAYVSVNAIDINDNPPVGENQFIHVLLYNGHLTLSTLGNLLIRDPDTVNDHEFTVTGGNREVFNIEFEGKIDILQHPPPPGVYYFNVHVTDGDLGEANTTVGITVVNITDSHLANSFTMRVESSSSESFLDTHFQLFLKSIENLVTEKVNVPNPKAYLFNITYSGQGTVDLSMVVESDDGSPIHPNLIQHLIHINRERIEESNGFVIVTENVDNCADERICPLGSGCSKGYQYTPASVVIGSAAATLAGINRREIITCSSEPQNCSVPCPEPSYCIQQNGESICIDDCTSNPCINSGKCQDQMPGYYCSCPRGFNGRNCELTTAYFQESSYALLPAVTTTTNGTIAIEFVAEENQNGLLFYSSRFDSKQQDFISLELLEGHVSLYISYGGEPLRLSVMMNGNGWYRAVVDYRTNVSVIHTHHK